MNHAIEAQYPFHCATPIQLRFNDIDALGHVNNSVYFQFFDLAKTEYFAGLEVNADINWCRPSIVIANVNCSFLVPTVFQEPVEVLTQCAHLGNKSLTLLQHLVNRDTHEVKGHLRHRHGQPSSRHASAFTHPPSVARRVHGI